MSGFPSDQAAINAAIAAEQARANAAYAPLAKTAADGTGFVWATFSSTTHPDFSVGVWDVDNPFTGNGFTFYDPVFSIGHNADLPSGRDHTKPSSTFRMEGDFWNNANPFTAGWTHVFESYWQFRPADPSMTVAVGSNGAVLPQATINVGSTVGFSLYGGSVVRNGDTVHPIAYTGVTATTLTGCTGGSGMLATGDVLTPASPLVNRSFFATFDWTSNFCFVQEQWDQAVWSTSLDSSKIWAQKPYGQNFWQWQMPVRIDTTAASAPVQNQHAQLIFNAPTGKQDQIMFYNNGALKFEIDVTTTSMIFVDDVNSINVLLLHAGTGTNSYAEFGGHLLIDAGKNLILDTVTGTKIGTVGGAAGQKLGFFNATPVVQPLLATGASATVDNVISALQTLGLVRQS